MSGGSTRPFQKLLKLRKMSAGEVAVRALDALQRRRDRRHHRRKQASAARAPSMPSADLGNAARRLVPGSTQLERLRVESPEMYDQLRERTLDKADAILAGRWTMLGRPFELSANIDWNRDPVSGFAWPRTFYADVPPAGGTPGVDIKDLWELGRQQYLVELAHAWALTGDHRYAEPVRDAMLGFIEACPILEGVHWSSSLEVAVRSIGWIWTLASLADWTGWRPGELDRIGGYLAGGAAFLQGHYSLYTSPYNHLIGEAAASYLLGCLFEGEGFRSAGRWRRRGREILERHGPSQFHADGFIVEQATGYHFFTLGFLMVVLAASREADDRFESLAPIVHRAFLAGVELRQPNGRWPAIGDIDSARSIPVLTDDFWNFDSLCNLAATTFDDPRLKLGERGPGEELFWLKGVEGLAAWQRLAPPDASPRRSIWRDSGYVLATSGDQAKDDWLLFDAGPIAHGLHSDSTPSTAHGHADVLQVLYSSGGRRMLIDGGMPFYFGSPDWVAHFRSPAAHNTIEVEGAKAARSAGALAWSHVAARPTLDATLSDDAWIARGRLELPGGVRVERHILAIPGSGLWIADWVDCDAPRRIRWYWQLPGDTIGGLIRHDPCHLHAHGEGFALTQSCSVPLEGRLTNPMPDSPVAWEATGYGQKVPAQQVCFESRRVAKAFAATYVGRIGMPFRVSLRLERTGWRELSESGEHAELELRRAMQPDAIGWVVEPEGVVLAFMAGDGVAAAGSRWTSVGRDGGWSAACLRPLPLSLPQIG